MSSLETDMALALDPVRFAEKRLDFKPDPWQARVLRWAGKRLILNCHRQSGKSTTTAIKALHLALYEPNALILLVSPSLRQSSELFRKVADFMDQLDVHPELTEDNRLSCTLENGSRVVSLPSSEGKIRGFSGVRLIIMDEASRVDDDLYFAVRPMLAISGGQLILMSTPYGKRGFFYQEWTAGGDVWERISVKATECRRIAPEFLAEERRALGEYFYSQEYETEFRDTVDQVFPTELIDQAVRPGLRALVIGGKR